jgi:ribosomal protein S18 acetylase RimI-like enzyme
MKTFFIGREEVDAYACDLASRLASLGDDFPRKWFTLGESGLKFAQALYLALPDDVARQVAVCECAYNRADDTLDMPLTGAMSKDESVLVIDSAIHSGRSMRKTIDHIVGFGAHNIISYSLVLKQGADIIPTYFGVLIGDVDRAVFQLDEIPNNRLAEGKPFGFIRKLERGDVGRTIGSLGAPFEGLSIGDLIYQREAYGIETYLFQVADEIAGFVSFANRQQILFVDAWATLGEYRGRGIGAATLRWAETLGRAQGCHKVQLWAYDSAVETYKRFGYRVVDKRELDLGSGPKPDFLLMERPLLHLGDRGN